MPITKSEKAERGAILTAANLMAASARTSPKALGEDNITTAIVTGNEKDEIASVMEKLGEERKRHSLVRDSKNVRNSEAVLLVGVKGDKGKGNLDCGACGYSTCKELEEAKRFKGMDFVGPICTIVALDLGIALGSAVKMASELNIDNRMMYSVGAAAKQMMLIDADVIMGVPLSVSGKNMYYDRK